eukprot:8516473-Prorocentrum_lima.AAC.1
MTDHLIDWSGGCFVEGNGGSSGAIRRSILATQWPATSCTYNEIQTPSRAVAAGAQPTAPGGSGAHDCAI